MGLLLNGVGLFSGERVVENTPTPLFEQPLNFMGVFSRAYGTSMQSDSKETTRLPCEASSKLCVLFLYSL